MKLCAAAKVSMDKTRAILGVWAPSHGPLGWADDWLGVRPAWPPVLRAEVEAQKNATVYKHYQTVKGTWGSQTSRKVPDKDAMP